MASHWTSLASLTLVSALVFLLVGLSERMKGLGLMDRCSPEDFRTFGFWTTGLGSMTGGADVSSNVRSSSYRVIKVKSTW